MRKLSLSEVLNNLHKYAGARLMPECWTTPDSSGDRSFSSSYWGWIDHAFPKKERSFELTSKFLYLDAPAFKNMPSQLTGGNV